MNVQGLAIKKKIVNGGPMMKTWAHVSWQKIVTSSMKTATIASREAEAAVSLAVKSYTFIYR